MAWLSVILRVRLSEAEAVCDLFLGWGALSAGILYDGLGRRAEGSEPPCPASAGPNCEVRILVPERSDVPSLLARAGAVLSWGAPPASRVERISDRDWVRAAEAGFRTIRIRGKLLVRPAREAGGDSDLPSVCLDPGLAFGTGSHPTTRLCLEWLADTIRPGESVLDYGCGSGILALAAGKLGAGEVFGVDNDPTALAVSAANARRNGVDLTLYRPGEASHVLADRVVANLYSGPLKQLASRLARHTRRGGAIALSGLLEDQGREVADLYHRWFHMAAPVESGGWIRLSGEKR